MSAHDRLTPRSIALGILVDLFANADITLAARQGLAIVLLEQVLSVQNVSVLEPSLPELRAALAPVHSSLREEFERRLLATTEPDDLWDLMGSLGDLMAPAILSDENHGPYQLEKSSMLGLFVRRIHLAFRQTSFEEICTLITHFVAWVRAPDEQMVPPTIGTATPTTPQPSMTPKAAVPLATDPFKPADPLLASLGVPSTPAAADQPKQDDGGAPPAYSYVLPASQLEAHVHSLARQLEEGSASTASPEMAAQIARLLELAPHVPQVHYLQLIHHLQSRSYEDALEAFHRYFDLLRAASAPNAPGPGYAHKEATRAPTQWASLNLARLQLSFCQREQAVAAIQEAVRSAQQQEDNVCLAYALLWMYHTQAGAGADAWGGTLSEEDADGTSGGLGGGLGGSASHAGAGLSAAAGTQRQQALLQRCLARAHELALPELAALASQALALISIDAAASVLEGAQPVTPPATAEPILSVGRAPCLPPVPLGLPGALPAMPAAQPPPLHAWESLRCGAEGCGGSVQLVRACAWERFGEHRLASLYAGLQLKFYRTSDATATLVGASPAPVGADGANPPSAAAAQGSQPLGQELVRVTMADRVLAACKLAVLTMGQQGEHAALTILVALRERCFSNPPLRSIWLQHTADVLIRGALLRGERRRASELLAQQKELLAATDGPSDAVWEHELELMLQRGELLDTLLKADELSKRPATGKGSSAASPKAMLLLIQAKAHSLGGEPLSAMPHALSAMALAEKASLLGLHSAAALELVEVQLNVDAARALSLLQRVRAQVMRNGSAYEVARLQFLSAKCRLAMLPAYNEHKPLQLPQLQPHILPALNDALAGFGKLRCHSDAAALLYIRARIWHSVGSFELRDRDARHFGRAEQEASLAAAKPVGRILAFAEVGVLEAHLEQLKGFDVEASSVYGSA